MQPPLSVFSFRLKNEVGDSLISPMDNYSNKMADFIFFFIVRTHFCVSPLNQYLQQHADGMYHKSRFWTLPNIYIHIYMYICFLKKEGLFFLNAFILVTVFHIFIWIFIYL